MFDKIFCSSARSVISLLSWGKLVECHEVVLQAMAPFSVLICYSYTDGIYDDTR